jgi:hypothetical protein
VTPLPAWAARLLRRELKFVESGFEFNKEAAEKLLALLAPRRKNEKQKATQKRKLEGAQAARARSAEIRRKVWDRSGGVCEAWKYRPFSNCIGAFEWDHWHGGKDRKRLEAVATTWMLCGGCHRERQRNEPSAAYWNDLFGRHCAAHGYPFTPHVEHAQLPGRAAR